MATLVWKTFSDEPFDQNHDYDHLYKRSRKSTWPPLFGIDFQQPFDQNHDYNHSYKRSRKKSWTTLFWKHFHFNENYLIKITIIIIHESQPGQPGEEPKGESQLLWDPPLLTSASPDHQNAQTNSPGFQNAQKNSFSKCTNKNFVNR